MERIKFLRYNDLILFEEKSFLEHFQLERSILISGSFRIDCCEDFNKIRTRLKFHRAGIFNSIQNDQFRSPKVHLFYSDSISRPIDPWVMCIENGIKYTFDVTRSMFCKGNINEKLRLAKINCKEEIIVDLFAGIGYFSLVFAVHCKAHRIYCCEWNPAALEALKRNIKLNKVENVITIIPGDSRLNCPKAVAQRIQMGLLPSSYDFLKVATAALNLDSKHSKWIIHYHENVNYCHQIKSNQNLSKQEIKEKTIARWTESLLEQIRANLLELNPNRSFDLLIESIHKVKRYAPHIDHLVADISVRRSTNHT
ncbi:S-adenosylmethionine-dependent methyltransferase-like protein [Sarcoptes scabiei]|nr:S-adenosylmethionine-dependent methyltransferase-like protein [Sarcoptes scabiei]